MILTSIKRKIRAVLPERYLLYRREQMLQRIKTAPRYTRLSSSLLGPSLKIADGLSFYFSFKEIFDDEIYFFQASTPSPYILDCGANIGLSILYFKRLYPDSRITAFEPEPHLFNILEANIQAFGCSHVSLINKAIWTNESEAEFIIEGADGSRLVHPVDQARPEKKIQVQTVRLRDYLRDDPIDFLKIDTEGAETDVLLDCADSLDRVQKFFIEYHSFVDEEQRLDELLHILRITKFKIRIYSHFLAKRPLIAAQEYQGQDMQLNIFGYRA